MKELKYKTTFFSVAKCLIDEEKSKFLSIASLKDLNKLVPIEVTGEGKEDLLPVVSNLCVIGMRNRNDDAVTSEVTIPIYKSLVHKPLNLEHKRSNTVGHVVTANFSKFNLDYTVGAGSELITEEEARKIENGVFNLSYAGVLYRLVNPDFIDTIIESNDPTSDSYLSISSSFEVGFSDYSIAVGSNIVKEAEIISRDKNEKIFDELDKILKSNGGTGKKDKSHIYRVIDKDVIFLGGGFTLSPAGQVKGVLAVDSQEDTTNKNSDSSLINDKSTINSAIILNNSEENDKKISQLEKTNVTINSNNSMKKITKVQDITDELLKEVNASTITDFINDEIKLASEKWVKEKTENETSLKEAKTQYASLVTEHDKVKKDLEKIQSDLKKVQDEVFAREQTEKFNQRMASLDNDFNFTEEDRKIVANKIKNLCDETYIEYVKELNILSKEKSKAYIQAKEDEAKNKNAQSKEVKASTNEPVGDALDKAKVEKTIPNSTAPQLTMKDKYAKAFAEDQWEVKTKKR